MQKIQIYDLNTGEITLEENYALNRNSECFNRFAYLCYVSKKDERVELFINDVRVASYNFGGAL